MLKKSKLFGLKEFLMDEDAKVSQKGLIIGSIGVVGFAGQMISDYATSRRVDIGDTKFHSAHVDTCGHTNKPTNIHTNMCNHSSSCGGGHHSGVGAAEHSSYKKHCSNHNDSHNNSHNNNNTHNNQNGPSTHCNQTHNNSVPTKKSCHCNTAFTP